MQVITGVIFLLLAFQGVVHGLSSRCERRLRREYSHLVATLADSAAKQHAITALRKKRSTVTPTRASWPGGREPLPTCPSQLRHSGTISERSTCPWIEEAVHNADRYPPVLTDVRCICDRCLGKDTSKEACQRVEHRIPTFHITNEITCDYDIRESLVATGCTCVAEVLIQAASPREILRGPTHPTTTKRSVDDALNQYQNIMAEYRDSQEEKQKRKEMRKKKDKKEKRNKKNMNKKKNRRRRRQHRS